MAKMRLKAVNARLFYSDIVELKRRAAVRGLPYQTFLRVFVHRALGMNVQIMDDV